MKTQIAKLRLIGIVALAVALFLFVFEKKEWAGLLFLIATLSFSLVMVLHIYLSFKSGFFKNYLNYKKNEEEETL